MAGTSVPKVNGRDIVTGAHRYAYDVKRPGMLYGKVLYPPSFGATLASLDASAAEAMPGVKVVRDGRFRGGRGARSGHRRHAPWPRSRPDWKQLTAEASSRDVYEYFKQDRAGRARLQGAS